MYSYTCIYLLLEKRKTKGRLGRSFDRWGEEGGWTQKRQKRRKCVARIPNTIGTSLYAPSMTIGQAPIQIHKVPFPGQKSVDSWWVTKRRRLSWLTMSALIYEPKCGGWGVRGLSQWVQLYTWSQNKLMRSNSIFNLCRWWSGTADLKQCRVKTGLCQKR